MVQNCSSVLVTVYFSIGLLQIPDGILKQSRGAKAPGGSFKMSSSIHSKSTVPYLYHSHAYIVFTLTAFEIDFTYRYLKRKRNITPYRISMAVAFSLFSAIVYTQQTHTSTVQSFEILIFTLYYISLHFFTMLFKKNRCNLHSHSDFKNFQI